MTSYVQKKERMFREAGDVLVPKRSVGRMKEYPSCTDRRAWLVDDEPRRQYILELTKSTSRKCGGVGNFIPLEVLMDILCSQKVDECDKIRQKLAEMERLLAKYDQLELTDEQKRKLGLLTGDSTGATTPSSYYSEGEDDELCASGGGGKKRKSRTSSETGGDAQVKIDVDDLPKEPQPQAVEASPSSSDTQALKHGLESATESGITDLPKDYDGLTCGELRDMLRKKDAELEALRKPGDPVSTSDYDESSCRDIRALLKAKDAEIAKLKNQISESPEEDLRSQLSETKLELNKEKLQLDNAKREKEQLAKNFVSTKPQDVSSMEAEIESLRAQGTLSTDQETEIIKKELNVLRKYCDDLSNIQEENEQLKKEIEALKKDACKGDNKEKQALEAKVKEYAEQIALLKSKLNTATSDAVNSEEIQNLRRRSQLVDDVLNDREDIRRRSQDLESNMTNQKNELEKLRKLSQQYETENKNLANEVSELKKYREQEAGLATCELSKCQNEICNLKTEKNKLNEALECVSRERDDMIKQLAYAENELQGSDTECNKLKIKAQEADLLKLERDRLQLRLEEMQSLEVEVLSLVEQIKAMSIERDMYKRQICELDCIIADQEDEIKQLVHHIDRLSESIESQQDKVKKAMDVMQEELAEKNCWIENSVNQLNELKCFKEKCEDNAKQLIEKDKLIKKLTEDQGDNSGKMTQQLQEAQRENERLTQLVSQLQNACQFRHIDIMLEESKNAVDVVINEVQNYQSNLGGAGGTGQNMDSNLFDENRQLRKHSMEIQNLAQQRIEELTEQLKKSVNENVELKAENDLLQSLTKGIEHDLKNLNINTEDPISSSAMLCKCYDLCQQMERCREQNDSFRKMLQAAGIEIPESLLTDELKKAPTSSAGITQTDAAGTTEAGIQWAEHEDVCSVCSASEAICSASEAICSTSEAICSACEDATPASTKPGTPTASVPPSAVSSPTSTPAGLSERDDICSVCDAPSIDSVDKAALKEAVRTSIRGSVRGSKDDKAAIEKALRKSLEAATKDGRLQEDFDDVVKSTVQASTEGKVNAEQQLALEQSIKAQLKGDEQSIQDKYETEVSVRKSIEQENNLLKAELDANVEMVRKLSLDMEQIPAQTMELLSSVSVQFKEENDQLKSENAKLKEELTVLEEKLKKNAAFLALQDIDLQEVNERLESQITELQKELNAYKTSTDAVYEGTEAGLNDLAKLNAELEKQIETLKNEINRITLLIPPTGLTNTEDELININRRQTAEIKRLETEVSSLIDMNSEVRRESLKTGEESCDMKIINYQLQCQIQDLLKENQELRAQLESEGAENLKDLIRAQEAEMQELRNKNKAMALQGSHMSLGSGDMSDAKTKDIIEKLKNEILDLQCENNCLRMCLTSTTPQDDKMANLELSLHCQNKKLEAELQDLKDELECMKTCEANQQTAGEELEMLRALNAELEKQLKRCQEELRRVGGGSSSVERNLQDELDKLRAMVDKLQKENANLNDLVKGAGGDAVDQLLSLQNKIKELEAAKADCEAKMEKLKQENKDLMDRLEEAVRRAALTEGELEDEIRKLKARIAELESKTQFAKDGGDDGRLKALEDKIKQLEADKAHLEARIAQLLREQDELTDKLNQKIRKSSVTETGLESEVLKLRAKVKELETLIKDLENQLSDCKKKLSQSADKQRLGDLEGELADITAQRNALQKEKDSLASENSRLKNQLSDLEKELENLRKQNAELKDRLKGMDSCQSEIDSLNAQLQALRNEIDKLKADSAHDKQLIDSLKKENDALKKDMKDLTDKLQLGTGVDDSAERDRLNALIKKLEDQLKKCEDEEGKGRSLADELQKLRDEMERLKAEHAKKLKELEDECKKNLALAKEQYEKDLNYIKGRHSEGITRLQSVHEDNFNDTIKNFQREIENLQAQLADAMKRLKTCQDSLSSKDDEINKLKNELSSLQNTLASKESELAKLKKDLESEKAKSSSLESQLAEARQKAAECDQLRQQLADLQKQLNSEMAKNADLQKQLSDEKAKVASLNDELSKVKSELSSEKNKNAELTKALDDEKNKAAAAKAELDKLKADLDSERAKMKEMENQLSKLNAELNDEKSKNAQLAKDLESVRNELMDTKKKAADAEKALSDAQGNSSAKDEALNKAQKDLDNEKAKNEQLSKDLAAKEQENQELKSQVSGLKSEIDDLNKRIADLLKQIEGLTNENKKLQDQVADLLKQVDDLSNDNKRLQGEVDELNNENKKLQADNADLLQQIEAEKSKNADLDNMLSDLKKQLQDAENKISSLEGDLEKVKQELDDKIKELKQKEEENENLKNELREKDDALLKIQKEAENLKQQLDDCHDKIEAEKAKLAALENQLESLKSELDAQKMENENLKKLVDEENDRNKTASKALVSENLEKQQILSQLDVLRSSLKKESSVTGSQTIDPKLTLRSSQTIDPKLTVRSSQTEEVKEEGQEEKKEKKKSIKKKEDKEKPCPCAEIVKKAKAQASKPEITCPPRPPCPPCPPLPCPPCIPCPPCPPCPGLAQSQPEEQQPEKIMWPSSKKREKLTKATALIVDLKFDGSRQRLGLSKKTVVMAAIEPSSAKSAQDFDAHVVTLEEESPINLSRSIECILAKALKSGLENLTFEELQDLHFRTTTAASSITGPMKEPICSCTEQPKTNLMRRVATLESELAARHRNAQEKIQMLDRTLQLEKRRLADMKNALILERKRNNDLVSRIGMQTRENANIEVERDLLKRQSSYHEDRLQKLIISVEEEKAEKRKLEEELQKGKNVERSLKALLETEKERSQHIRCKASETIDLLRVRLEKSLESESQLRMKFSQSGFGRASVAGKSGHSSCICASSRSTSPGRSSIVEVKRSSSPERFCGPCKK